MRKRKEKHEIRLWAVGFWLIVWQLVSMWLDSDILLVSPVRVVCRLGILAVTAAFWRSVIFTLTRIALGFFLAALAGSVLAGLSSRFRRVYELLSPVMLAVKSIPVASFIILALIWFSSRNLSILISFLMVLPVIYTSVLGESEVWIDSFLRWRRFFAFPGCAWRDIFICRRSCPFFIQRAVSLWGLAGRRGQPRRSLVFREDRSVSSSSRQRSIWIHQICLRGRS